MSRWAIAALLLVVGAFHTASAQVGPIRLPGMRPTAQPTQRDTTKKDTLVKWGTPDSVMQDLMKRPDYSITRYTGETAVFDAQTRALNLLAAPKRHAAVQRDSEVVVSDSGIYYSESTKRVTTSGHYVLSNPGSGQADIRGLGQASYDLGGKAFTVTNANLPYDQWFMRVRVAQVVQDTVDGKVAYTTRTGPGSLTSCPDSIPDYHFEYKEAKRTAAGAVVASPAILYIKDIPVMWLPFLFSDTRSGRHSGILPPQFGLGDIVRSSPSYRRNVDHVGYYWAMNDYMDASAWLDWRSSAGATPEDPGWLRLNGEYDYKWLDRFLSGRVGVGYTEQRDGSTNLALSWGHQEQFGSNATLSTNVNYVTNTTLQRQNTFNPYQALATIASSATLSDKLGPATINVGGTQTQYPGRQQVLRTFPTFTLTSSPITIGKVFTWTPGFSYSDQQTLHMDQPGPGAYIYSRNPTTGLLDSSLATTRNATEATMSFDTPISILGYDIGNTFHVDQKRNDFPEQYTIYDVETGAITDTRVFAATYETAVDWTPNFTLPPVARNKFNLTPSLSLQNVDAGPFWVETERTNGQFVHQSKRPTFGLSASPTIFGLFPGFGPFTRIRHSLTPTISWTYAPAQELSDAYLAALGRTKAGYLGGLRQNALSFGLNQNFEAKIHQRGDTNPDHTETVRLLTLNFTSLTYDFERAHETGKAVRGFTTGTWGYTINSDFLPGLDFNSSYSLFQGDPASDTAVFKPYLSTVSATFNVSRTENPFTAFAKIFGRAVPATKVAPTTGTEQVRPQAPADSAQQEQLAAMPVAGSGQFGDRFIVPPTNGWKASFSFSLSRPRPPVGNNVISFDPRARCEQITGGVPFLFDACIAQQATQPTNDVPVTSATAGGPAYYIPPTASINSDISFNLTPKWAAHWTTTYDVERHEFASQIVNLQRELHDWRAIFGFTQSPNGNFAFTFTIALKADPDVKFDYNRATVRSGAVPF